jgi:hypothetical protein
MQRIIFLHLTLALFSSCNPGHKLDQGRTLTGEAYKSANAESPTPTPDVVVPEPESQVLVTEEPARASEGPAQESMPPPAPTVEADRDEDDSNNKTAMEPVPIGGAYLTCRYQNGQMQGNENYRMDCEVAPLTDVKVPIASAAFYKVDGQGNRSPLTLVTQDLLTLKWTVQDSIATMAQTQVEVVLGVPGLLSTTLTTTVSTVFNLVQNPVYWLGGEPNTLTADEDCVEFVPLNGKISHQNFSGITSGPLGRMNDIGCTNIYRFLCRNISAGADAAKWTVSANAGPFTDNAMACSPGYAFAFPLNATEVMEVITLVDSLDVKVWVNMNDRVTEGTYSIKFR